MKGLISSWIKDPKNLNQYTYVKNNPLKYIDSTGNVIDTITLGGDTRGTTTASEGTTEWGEDDGEEDKDGNPRGIIIPDRDRTGAHWTYRKNPETGEWEKHYTDSEGNSTPWEEVTDPDEIEVLEELLEMAKKKYEEEQKPPEEDISSNPGESSGGGGVNKNFILS
ncbi:MAG: hypothetical protein ACE5HW_05000 [Candidatus Methanofastidiosia archaeon]